MADLLNATVTEQIERAIDEIYLSDRPVGVSVGIVHGDELVWSKGFGYADLDTHRPADDRTMFKVGSITKTFTAAAIFRLRDAGKLSIDDRVIDHIEEFGAVRPLKGKPESITLRHLLCHHSGLSGEAAGKHWETLDFPTTETILSTMSQVGILIEPETTRKYSSLGFALLGEIVTRRSGRPYEEYVTEEILKPLGMESSTFGPSNTQRGQVAIGYGSRQDEDRPELAPNYKDNGGAPAGGLYSTVPDLAKWLSFQLNSGEASAVLGPGTLREMQRPQYLTTDWSSADCLPWTATRQENRVYLSHGGSTHGFMSNVSFSVERRLGLIVLANSHGHGAVFQIARQVMDIVADIKPQTVAARKPSVPSATPVEWESFLGTYEGIMSTIVGIRYRDGSLQLESGGYLGAQVNLDPTDDRDVFVLSAGRMAGEELCFKRSADGQVTGLNMGGLPADKLVHAGE
jgi:CubicO group peptidase (beta-lactamase class C family)